MSNIYLKNKGYASRALIVITVSFIVQFFTANYSCAQPSAAIQALSTELKSAQTDSGKVEVLCKFSDEYIIIGNLEKASDYARRALQLAQNIRYIPGINKATNNIGSIFKMKGDFPNAIHYFQLALNNALEYNDKRGIANANFSLGTVATEYRDFSKALSHFEDARKLFSEINDKKGEAKNLHSLGNISRLQGDINEAIEYYTLAMKVAEECDNKVIILASNMGMADIYEGQQKYDLAIDQYKIALEMAETMGHLNAMSICNSNMALVLSRLERNEEAMEAYQASLELDSKIGDEAGMAAGYWNIGNLQGKLGYTHKAIEYLNKALLYYDKINFQANAAGVHRNLGIHYASLGKYPDALQHFNTAFRFYQRSGDTLNLGHAYMSIGTIYFEMDNCTEAMPYFEEALRLMEQVKNSEIISSVYFNIGSCLYNQNHKDEALNYYLKSKQLAEKHNLKRLLGDVLNNIASVYFNDGKFEAGISSASQALQIAEDLNDQDMLVQSLGHLGIVYAKTGQFEESKFFLERALKLGYELKKNSAIAYALGGLTFLYDTMGNYKKAFEFHKELTAYNDSLLNESMIRKLADLKTSHEVEKRDFEIQQLESDKAISTLQLKVQESSILQFQLEQEKARAANLLQLRQIDLLNNESRLQQAQLSGNAAALDAQKAAIHIKEDSLKLLEREGEIHQLKLKSKTAFANYLIGAFLILCLLGFMAYKQYHTRQQLKLQKLRNKIASDLHDDVGSTLSSISIFSEMAQQQSKEVQPLLQTIQNSSRNMLEAMADIVWTINPENDQFEKIVMRMRNFAFELLGAKQIDFEFNADEEINRMKLPMDIRKNLYLIFKEATNNLVKYSEASEAEFSIRNEEDKVVMMIRDNGKGFDPDQPSEGNGLKSMRKRAADMGADFLVKSFPGQGTMIQLKIAV